MHPSIFIHYCCINAQTPSSPFLCGHFLSTLTMRSIVQLLASTFYLLNSPQCRRSHLVSRAPHVSDDRQLAMALVKLHCTYCNARICRCIFRELQYIAYQHGWYHGSRRFHRSRPNYFSVLAIVWTIFDPVSGGEGYNEDLAHPWPLGLGILARQSVTLGLQQPRAASFGPRRDPIGSLRQAAKRFTKICIMVN